MAEPAAQRGRKPETTAGRTPPRLADGAPAIYLARHGRTAYNHERRFQGLLPVPLDDVGREQAAQLAEACAERDFAALWCSPLLRARETAAIVAARIGLAPREDPRLMETDAGEWTDRTFEEVLAEAPREFARFAAHDPGFAFPGGESFAHQRLRVQAAIDDIAGGRTPALVVCHGVVIRLALASFLADEAVIVRVPNATLVPLDDRAGGLPLADRGDEPADVAGGQTPR